MTKNAATRALRALLLLALAVLTGLSTSAAAEDKAALLDRLHRVEQDSSLDDPALKPWHLKLNVQLYDDKGQPSETGTIEEWWAGQEKDRQVYTFPSYTATTVRNFNGYFRTPGVGSPPYVMEALHRGVVHPMPRASEVADSIPDLRKHALGKNELDCVMLDEPIKGIAYPPLGLFPTYCLNHGEDVLRASYNFGTQVSIRNRIGVFQGRRIAIESSLGIDGKQAAGATITALGGLPDGTMDFSNIEGLTLAKTEAAKISSDRIKDTILEKVSPIYPDVAKQHHSSGTVVLRVIIGTEGRIHTLWIVSTPDPDLAIAAIAAVRQWIYKPYMLDGEPREVDTNVTVNFSFR